MVKPKAKEYLTLYSKGLATFHKIGRDEEAEMHGADYSIIKDEISPDDTRTIVVKKRDATERQRKLNKIIETILKQLGEGESNLLRKLLKDATLDYYDETIDELYEDVVTKGKPVKAREGCFKIIVGDGRRRRHHEIQLLG